MDKTELENGLRKIQALAFDVDGVLTDGGLWWGADGGEWKRFCFADVMGISLARRAGLKIGLISGEDSSLVDRYAAKLKIDFVAKGRRDKATALKEFAVATGTDLAHICYVGDDVNDLAAMKIAGLSAAPASACSDAIALATIVTKCPGGNGAVRELIEAVLAAHGLDILEVFSKS
jgi:3-deoxy-D-manno-octulosonate 8-phosphate phosphatase (KDO 8-P phosphatase)